MLNTYGTSHAAIYRLDILGIYQNEYQFIYLFLDQIECVFSMAQFHFQICILVPDYSSILWFII